MSQPPQDEVLFGPGAHPTPEYGRQARRDEVKRPPGSAEQRNIDDNTVMVGPSMDELSLRAAAKAMGRAGTMRRAVFTLIKERGRQGATSDEVEQILNRPHQSISATFNSLWNDLLITRVQGQTRITRWGNDAQVYVVSEQGLAAWERLP